MQLRTTMNVYTPEWLDYIHIGTRCHSVASRSISPRGGQSGVCWLSARTMHSRGAYVRVVSHDETEENTHP